MYKHDPLLYKSFGATEREADATSHPGRLASPFRLTLYRSVRERAVDPAVEHRRSRKYNTCGNTFDQSLTECCSVGRKLVRGESNAHLFHVRESGYHYPTDHQMPSICSTSAFSICRGVYSPFVR